MSNLKTIHKNVSQKTKKNKFRKPISRYSQKKASSLYINCNAINFNDSFINCMLLSYVTYKLPHSIVCMNLELRDNISIIPESTEIINHKNSKNANTKYKKIKKKTVLAVGDSMVNGIEESKLSMTATSKYNQYWW